MLLCRAAGRLCAQRGAVPSAFRARSGRSHALVRAERQMLCTHLLLLLRVRAGAVRAAAPSAFFCFLWSRRLAAPFCGAAGLGTLLNCAQCGAAPSAICGAAGLMLLCAQSGRSDALVRAERQTLCVQLLLLLSVVRVERQMLCAQIGRCCARRAADVVRAARSTCSARFC